MITSILIFSIVIGIIVWVKKKQSLRGLSPEKEKQAEQLSKAGEKNAAAEIYLAILEKEYAREIPRATVITHYTDKVLPLLRVTERVEEEITILRKSMSKCVMNTYSRSWNKWQKRLSYLDTLYPEK